MLVPRTKSVVFDANADSPIDLTPQVPADAASSNDLGDVIGAAFRQENVIGSLLARQSAGGERDPSYNPWEDIKGTEYEDHWDSFVSAGNSGQTAAMKRQIDMETEDRNTIASSGGWGMLATLGASIFSPENLIPGGQVYRGAKLGRAVLKTALATGAATALGTSLAEVGLMGSQELRTPMDSAFNVGGSALLGGVLGAGLSAAFTKADFARVAQGMTDEALAGTDFKTLAGNEAAVFSGVNGPTSAGAAARPIESIEDNTIAGAAAQFAGGAVRNLNPVLRALHSPSAVMRDVATRLFENPIYMKKNFEGVASAPGVETLVKEYTQGAMARAVDQANGIYGDFRKAGGQLDRDGFNEAIGRAMRRGDDDADPAIAKAAASWRAAVFDPLKERAIAAGLLPKDVTVDTALSYFTRVYNRPMIEAREGEFKGIVKRYISQQIRDLELKQDEIKLGNTIVKADSIGERFASSSERMARMDERLSGRSAIRSKKLGELNELDRRKFLADQGRPPVELVRLLRGADENANMLSVLRDARKAQRSAGRKQTFAEKSPVLAMVKRKGGVRIGTPLDYELRTMGVTPQTHPGLFRKDSGQGGLDNWPWGEDEVIFDNLPMGNDGYVDERSLIAAIREELAGNPLRTKAQEAADAEADNLSSWAEQWLQQLGLSADTNVGTAKDFIRRINGAEKNADEMVERSGRLQRELEQFDDATELVNNERSISEVEMQAVAKEMNDLNEEILAMQQIANASPRVGLIVDYAKTRRDLFKKKLDERNLTKRVDALKALRDDGRANDAMLNELYAKTEDLTRVVSDVQRLTAKADKLQPMMPKMSQEIPNFLDDGDRTSYVDEIVNDIFNTITGRNADGDVPREIVAATRGPLKERTFHIPDEQIEGFLESNVEAVARRYARTMASDIELTNQFGKADLAEQITQIKASYLDLRAAVSADLDPNTGAPLPKPLTPAQKEAAIKRLVGQEKSDVRDIQALRDMVRGAYLAKENSSNFARVARVAGTVNYLRTMGGVTLSSVTDVARHVMVHGLSNVMRDGLVPLIGNMRGFKMSVDEAKVAGAVTERLLNTRMATWADINDPYAMGSPFERFMDNTANGFSRLTGMTYWNDFQKSFASVITQNRVLRNAGNYAALDNREKAYMAYLGIDGSMAERIANQFETHGSTEGGNVRVAGTDAWDDDWARRVYRAAINKDVDSTIVMKGVGDIPLFMNTPAGRMLGQFKGFALASHQRALMRGLQERPMGFVSGTMLAATVGMMIYYLKSVESNRAGDISNNPGRWIAEGLDRSGIFSIAFEANNTIEKAFGIGAYGALAAAFPGAAQDGKSSRYSMRSTAAALTGPTGDLIDGAIRAAQGIKGAGNGFTAGDISSIRRLVPGATLPGIRSLVEYLGMPAVEQAMDVK